MMKSKKLSFWNAVSNAISIVALTVLIAVFYAYSAILLGLCLLKREIRMGLTTTRRRRGSFLILSTILGDQFVDWGSFLLFSSLI